MSAAEPSLPHAEALPEAPAARRSRASIGFLVGFVAAAAMTGLAAAFAISGAGPIGPASGAIWGLVVASLAILAVLAVLLVHRVARIARSRNAPSDGARLHLRFVSLFSIAAVAPAVVVAVFTGAVLSRGVEEWFSARVETVVERGADVGRQNVALAEGALSFEVEAMATDLNAAREGLQVEPERYGQFLAGQAERRGLAAAYVLTRAGEVLASAEQSDGPALVPPGQRAFDDADRGEIVHVNVPAQDLMLALFRLQAYPDAYLYVAQIARPGMLPALAAFDQAVADYRDVERRRDQVQFLFALSYLSMALLVFLGSVWLGLSNASRIAEPIGRLADAARRVAAGDLHVRVRPGPDRDEVDQLSNAFNQMTSQLGAQRTELLRARHEAEGRSQFIQAVLGGVSAGVVGLDRDGRITAVNRSAGQLLGADANALEGRRLVDVAPEFADLLNSATPQEETPPVRVDLDHPGGPLQLSVRMSPVAEGGGLVLTFDDMSKLIAAQRQEAWKDVARRIAHEIKNPLTPIQLSAERLQRKYGAEITSDPETFRRCTDTIVRQVSDIGRMVDEFSSFARMPTPILAFADMAEVSRSVVFAQRLSEPDVQVEAEGIEAPIALVCDERLISQALANLLKNASDGIHARRIRDGEPKDGRILLRLRDLDYGVQFEVIDNGVGFPEQDRARLIEPYVTTRTRGSGMGLGLAIVARIVEDHGGLLELDDAPGPGPGAVVRFVLPKRADLATGDGASFPSEER